MAAKMDPSGNPIDTFENRAEAIWWAARNKANDTAAEITSIQLDLGTKMLSEASQVVSIIVSLFTRIEYEAPVLGKEYSGDSYKFFLSLEDLIEQFQRVDRALVNIRSRGSVDDVSFTVIRTSLKNMREIVMDALKALRGVYATEPGEKRNAALSLVSSTLSELSLSAAVTHLGEVLVDVEQTRDAVNVIADDTRESAGLVGTGEMAKHYLERAASEKVSADRLRLASVTTTLCIAAIGIFVALRGFEVDSVANELAKLAIVVPLGALAIYFAKESTSHRTNANHAATVHIQLQTVRAYTDDLPQAQKDEIKGELARRIFGTGPSTENAEGVAAPSGDSTSNVLNAIARLAGRPNV